MADYRTILGVYLSDSKPPWTASSSPLSAQRLRWQQMLADPEAGPVARETEVYLRYLDENCECPTARFERLFGYPLP